MKYKAGDRIVFTRGSRVGEKGTILSVNGNKDASFSIAGIPWYSIKLDPAGLTGYCIVVSGQFEGDFKKLRATAENKKRLRS